VCVYDFTHEYSLSSLSCHRVFDFWVKFDHPSYFLKLKFIIYINLSEFWPIKINLFLAMEDLAKMSMSWLEQVRYVLLVKANRLIWTSEQFPNVMWLGTIQFSQRIDSVLWFFSLGVSKRSDGTSHTGKKSKQVFHLFNIGALHSLLLDLRTSCIAYMFAICNARH
jgi:hypothetical protein